MATGDQNDFVGRLQAVLPKGWFGSPSPALTAALNGFAAVLALAYGLIHYAKNQTRIATASDGFLDLISYDFFGLAFPRRAGEQDNPFRARIQANLLRERATRNGINQALLTLTGRVPIIFEPWRPADTGGWSSPNAGWSTAGGWGSIKHPAQFWVTAFRPASSGIPNVIGWGGSAGGWSTPSQFKWSNLSQIQGFVTDGDIYAAVDAAKPAGTTAWVRISN